MLIARTEMARRLINRGDVNALIIGARKTALVKAELQL